MAEKRKDKDGRLLPENVIQRKDGSYMWKKTIDGKQYCEYAKTLGEIKQKRNVALGEIAAGSYKGKHERMKAEREQAEKDITVNEWFFQWEKEYRVGKVREATLQHNHHNYMIHFADNIGRMKIRDVKQIDIVKIYNQMKKDGASNNSLDRYHTILLLLFGTAADNGLIESNPAKGALKLPEEKAVEKRILTEQEENTFLEYIANNGYHKKLVPLFIVGFNTGMRIGEILALTWQDIDFEKSIIHVDKTLSYLSDWVSQNGKKRFVMNPPKTEKSIRDVPMLPKVKEALLYQRENGTKSTVTIDGYKDFIFCTKSGNVYTASNLWYTINRAVDGINKMENEKAQIENRDPVHFERFSAHSMRHTFATRCYEKGMKPKVVQQILGHNSLDMTLNVYTHVTESMIAEDMKKLEG